MDLEIIKLSQVDRERQKSYDITYKWNLKKWYKWIYLQNRLIDIENKLWLPKGKGEEGDKLGIWDTCKYPTIYKIDNQQGPSG